MKDGTTSVVGFDPPVSGIPTTIAECVEASGGEEQAVTLFVGWAMAHKVNTEARGEIVEALEKATGISRATEQVKSPTKSDPNRMVEKWAESEQTFTDRVRAETKQTSEQLWALIKDTVGVIPFQAKGEGRAGGPGRVGKEDAKKAETVINAGAEMWSQVIAKLQEKNPGLEVALGEDGKPVLESLAQAIRVNRQRLLKEEDASIGLAA